MPIAAQSPPDHSNSLQTCSSLRSAKAWLSCLAWLSASRIPPPIRASSHCTRRFPQTFLNGPQADFGLIIAPGEIPPFRGLARNRDPRNAIAGVDVPKRCLWLKSPKTSWLLQSDLGTIRARPSCGHIPGLVPTAESGHAPSGHAELWQMGSPARWRTSRHEGSDGLRNSRDIQSVPRRESAPGQQQVITVSDRRADRALLGRNAGSGLKPEGQALMELLVNAQVFYGRLFIAPDKLPQRGAGPAIVTSALSSWN